MDGIKLAEELSKKGYQIKNKTKTSIVVLVDGDRVAKMKEIAKLLGKYKPKIDASLKGSSIGGIVIGNVKILIKASGRTGGLDVESAAIAMLQEAIANAMAVAGGPINIKLKNKTIKDVVGVRKTAGTPKSDFHLINSNQQPVCNISHKKGSSPKDFQQWGGITESAIASHKEVKYFEKQVNAIYPNKKIPQGESAFMKIKDDHLKMMAVYGVNYKNGGVDFNKVDVLIQGDPGLKQINNNTFQITATGNLHYLPEKITGGFEPVLSVIYKGDRTQLGLAGARANIYPMAGRTFKREIKNNLK